jgi:hypothetical protein
MTESTHGHEDWAGSDHQTKEHKEALDNGSTIHVVVRQLGADHYESEITVLDEAGANVYHKVKDRKEDPGPAAEILKFAIDEAKRHAGGHKGAPLDDHHQATPI